ncbi:S-methyl-5-thioribose-1-phosphate isomerase [Psychrobacillus lasiicapitis]|uniref:Methylthioribose-1-phosphate isomerase n=1 Tax=Psychrobacillus lasiicapitis TaxID=1636719 RepID=A0A544SU15_9BACI|nr:S-methyl-5-thioribose-1-phosphate isomerase [Psychrobacillus lasiicapitis]TQR08645.1 S-methyl-5-thioribose-1-phosphate isomerase [Psychrobacillus lasiicapitis]GGA45218.1 methylthioribose-1-phosphate isomerase 2 [Psychrobacillus lasiicapitis]
MTIPLSIKWNNNKLEILNQQKLPLEVVYETLETLEDVYDAILTLKVRGAPAIGITASYGLAAAAQFYETNSLDEFHQLLSKDALYLAESRPTAVNLVWALERLRGAVEQAETVQEAKMQLLDEADNIYKEDEASCRAIGEYALSLLEDFTKVMTICNAGTIATAKYGTALAPFHLGSEKGKQFQVYACETRPVFQGARLTVWELQQSGVDVTLITDSMAAHTIGAKGIEAIIVGADRIAVNGDTANKIGTLNLALLAAAYQIPFYVAAPSSTFDLSIANGETIQIEERSSEEITHIAGKQVAPINTKVYNPAFDVTPAHLITAIITEKGIIYPEYSKNIVALLGTNKGEKS